jgi:hypothetical protein
VKLPCRSSFVSELSLSRRASPIWTDVSAVLTDDIGLCGGFLTWLTKEKRPWLSGRYVSVNWDTAELEGMKDEIFQQDKLVMRMNV